MAEGATMSSWTKVVGLCLLCRHEFCGRHRFDRGVRSPGWLKLKPKLTPAVTVTGGSSERITWGD